MAISVTAILWQMNKPRRKTLGVVLAMGGAVEPADLELEAEEVTFNLPRDNTTTPGWIIKGSQPDGPVVVVVHGHRDSRFGSLYRAEMLKSYCSYIAVFDLPGHGDAEAKRCLMGDREADDVWSVAIGLDPDMLRGRQLVFLGYSMGAVVAVQAATKAATLVVPGPNGQGSDVPLAGVIACAPYRWWDEGLRGQLAKRVLPAWPLVPLVGLALKLAPGVGLGQRPGFDVAEDAAKLHCPVLVLHGDADTICPLSAGQAIAEAAPDGELVMIEGGTHNQLLAADYDAVHAALSSFFKKLGKGA
ncbi:MAG: alpha/beta fold hydrolase [Planctomycetota bacterium]